MISVRNLTKAFGHCRILHDLSFDVAPGQALTLWGTNGAGKTTVIRCALGLIPYRGTITIAGLDARRSGKQARHLVGYVPQELAFHDDLRLLETMQFFAKLRGVSRDRSAAVLQEVGLAGHENERKRIRELSGGMKQRMALALALLADPPALILDELTSNLDRAAQETFLELLRIQKQRGKAILFTSHRLDEVEHLSDRVIVLDRGCSVACEPGELAGRLGLRSTVQVFLAPAAGTTSSRLDAAVRVLLDGGYCASRNGTSLSVQVRPNDKAAPIRLLTEASIAVRDFEVTGTSQAVKGSDS